MDQLEAELDFNVSDFGHQIEQLGTPTELPLHYGDAEDGEAAPGYSGDGTPAYVPADEAISADEMFASTAVEDTAAMAEEAAISVPVKRKRGRPRKNPEARAVPLARKKERENVCFVCFDRTNPNLVSCNKRGCYKAYHPACINRDEDFFHSKAKWNCGWHICSNCQKAAKYMCYTCTTSYCKECITDESKYVCVRGTYGFCQSCHNTVTLIEQNKLAFEKDGSDSDDIDSFTYLFKAYWLDQKGRLSITSEELNNARHPCSVALDEESSDELYDVNEDHGSSSESSSGHHKNKISSKKKIRSRSQAFISPKTLAKEVDGGEAVTSQETVWASKELLELVAHMRSGDQSFISQFEVQALLLDYIKKYNLRDPRRKSQIICDLRLRNLFGKERVGHFEMLKLLESHFLSKEASQVFTDGEQVEASDPDNKLTDDVEEGDTFARLVSEKKRKNRKRIEEIEPQMNIDDYAAVDVHNVTQIFLRRSLVEELLDDIETFNDKVVGSFVRIRISNAGQRQDLYRLVQVVGTQEDSKPYKVGKKTTAFVLEILNLDKKETSSIDTISNQDFTEEECQRLRQSIKCGLIDRLKVGYIQEKAKVLHAVRVNDSIEAEKLRLSHLRDRASETGRRKQLRECVEKLQVLNNPEERRRRLNEVPRIHADPKMDPEYESLEEAEDDKNQDLQIRSTKDLSLRKRRELIPRGRAGNNWSGLHRSPNFNHESSRRMQGEIGQDTSERPNESLLNQSKEIYQSVPSFTDIQTPSPGNLAPKSTAQQPNSVAPEMNSANPNELEKIWHYVDPSNNFQGPFSLTQLRKWSTTGYFPPDMRIWRTTEKQEDSCLLADVLSGRFYTQHSGFPHQQNRGSWNAHQTINQPTLDGFSSQPPAWPTPGVEILNSGVRSCNTKPDGPIYNNPYQNPTYEETGRSGGNSGGWNPEKDYGNIWSPTIRAVDTQKIEDNLTSDPSVVVGTSISNERNSGINKYRTFESDCPSPTPRIENTEISQGFAAPLGTSDPSLATHPTNINFESANTDSVQGLAAEFTHNGAQKLDSSKSVSPEFSNNFSSVPGTFEDMGIQNVDTGFPSMDHTSLQKQFPIVSSLAPPSLLDQAQDPNPNFSPIHQLNPQSAVVQVDTSLPSPTPKSSNNTWGIDTPVPSQAVKNANTSWGGPLQGNPGWGPLANVGWGTPGQMTSNVNTGWGMPIQMNANANTNSGWGAPPQVNSNANTGWGTPVQMNPNANKGWGTLAQLNNNTNTGWGTPAPVNTNANTGWGTPVQVNPNANTGWAAPAQVNANTNAGWGTPAQVNTNPNAGWGMPIQGNSNDWGTMEAIPAHDKDANAKAGWGSSFGNKNGGDTRRRFSHDGVNSDGYSRHRYTARHGGTDSRNNSSQSGVRGGPSWTHQAPPEGDGQRGVCRFYESGHCKKGRYCTYLHTDTKRNIR